MIYKEVQAKTALHKIPTGKYGYSWDLNIYRGCFHRCKYCYALYSHEWLDPAGGFFGQIFVKENITQVLEKELSSPRWSGAVINLGGVTDSYQKCEERYQLMRQVLKVMIKHQNPINISTKSDLILRDLDLIKKLSAVAQVAIGFTITAADELVRRQIEPYAPTSERRFTALKKIKQETQAITGLHAMPFLPFITDTEVNIDQLFSRAREVEVDYCLACPVRLMGQTRRTFLDFIRQDYSQYYEDYLKLYKHGQFPDKEYYQKFRQLIYRLKKKHFLSSRVRHLAQEDIPEKGQLKLSGF